MRTVKSKSKSNRATPQKRATGKAATHRTESVKETRKASADAAKVPADAVKAPVDAVAEATAAVREQVETLNAEVSADISKAAGEATGLSKTALDAWAESGSVVAKGVEDMSRAWLRLTQQSLENGVAAARAMLGARTLHDVVGVQSDYARNSFGSLIAETTRLSEVSARVAQEAMRPIQARFATGSERRSRPAA